MPKNKLKIERYFLALLELSSGLGLFSVSLEYMKFYGINIANISDKGYENGSNMKGKHQ
jgi:hypothetical protein